MNNLPSQDGATPRAPARPDERAWTLADAVERMALRYGQTERDAAHAFSRHLIYRRPEDLTEQQRHDRAARRQYRAMVRLIRALRDRDGTLGHLLISHAREAAR